MSSSLSDRAGASGRTARGFVLATTLILMPICLLLLYVFMDKIMTATDGSVRERGKFQCQYMAEAGLAVAYDAFRYNNFAGYTHINGTIATGTDLLGIPPQTGPYPTLTFAPETSGPYAGWFLWQWDPSQSATQCFCDGVQNEQIRFRVYPTSTTNGTTYWEMDCQASCGAFKQTLSHLGLTENNAMYAMYSAGDLNDLSRADQIDVTGRIHANGNIYFMPHYLTNWTPLENIHSNTNLGMDPSPLPFNNDYFPVQISAVRANPTVNASVTTTEISTPANVIRSVDGYNNTYNPANSSVVINNAPMIDDGTYNSYDSLNPQWPTIDNATFGGVIKDWRTGGEPRDNFDSRTVMQGGWYDRQAQAANHIILDGPMHSPKSDVQSILTACCNATPFFNNAENRTVTVNNLSIHNLTLAWPQWPAKGLLIYSTYPLRLIDAEYLPGPLTVVCTASLYTQGDFNLDNGTIKHQPAALITSDRLYHLSEGWVDNQTAAPAPQTDITSKAHIHLLAGTIDITDTGFDETTFPPHASMPTHTTGPYAYQLVINADLVDGVPLVNELNWVKSYNGAPNPTPPHYGQGSRVPAVNNTPWQAGIDCAPGCESLLEEFHMTQLNTTMPAHWGSAPIIGQLPYPPTPDGFTNYPWTSAKASHVPQEVIPGNDTSFPSITIVKQGAIMHIQTAKMGAFVTNPPTWDTAANVTPWLVKSFYTPWIRNFQSDPMFTQPNPQLPVFTPNISHVTLWAVKNDM